MYAEAKDEAAAGNYDKRRPSCSSASKAAPPARCWRSRRSSSGLRALTSGEKAQALTTLERFIKLNPTSPALDYALYLQGVVNFNDNLGLLGNLAAQDLSERDQQASRDSYQSFKQLVDQFPQSIYADDARLRMNYIVNSLAAYEVHVARYYFRRGAYVAAANRAQQAVQEFQQSPSAEEALYIMVQSYDRLGLTDLRDDAQRVLREELPEQHASPATAWVRASKPWWQFW